MTKRQTMRVVSLSGGKDSTATALLALRNYPHDLVRLVYADTGNEHELTERYVFDYLPEALGLPINVVRADFAPRITDKRRYIETHWPAKGVPQSRVDRALELLQPTGNPFLDLCLWKGRVPSRKAQFCTQELKRYPLDAYLLERMVEGYAVESWRGIRRDESTWRHRAKSREAVAEGWTLVHPILKWRAQHVVDFVLSQGLKLNPLYSMGMGRVGCMPCINCGKDELLEIARRFPEHIDRIREWEQLIGEVCKRGRATFFAGKARRSKVAIPGWRFVPADDEEPAHWREPDEEVFDRYQIDSMVGWAKTARGGRQFDMLRSDDADVPACSSVYGLCE